MLYLNKLLQRLIITHNKVFENKKINKLCFVPGNIIKTIHGS